MDFIYRPSASISKIALSQGDVLERTAECLDAISQAHQYYAEAQHYTHFVVITQSCDLVRRGGNRCNAPYITIAAAKPLSVVLNERIGLGKKIPNSPLYYRTPQDMKKAKQLVERYINNTEDNHFFLPKSLDHGMKDDLVTFLHLSIALRIEHYDVLAASKVAELDEVFQAKLGWLKGNIYSRVATPDLDERGLDGNKIKSEYYQKYVSGLELSGHRFGKLKQEVQLKSGKFGRDLTLDEVLGIIKSGLPDDIDIIAEKIVERLIVKDILPKTDVDLINAAREAIANASILKGIIS